MTPPHGPGLFRDIRAFVRDERGATAIEYGLICALIALVIVAAMSTVFTGIGAKFNVISSNISH